MNKLAVVVLACVGIFCISCSLNIVAAESDELVIADFESDDYGQWIAEGDAFGPAPAKGALKSQMAVSGYEGKHLVNSFYGGDGSTGTLTSPVFKVERKYINFLIGGGMHPETTCINLLIDGKVVRTATGPNDKPGGAETLTWHAWDVSGLIGKMAVIRIVDQQKGGWGHINIDQIFQSSEKVKTDSEVEIMVKKKYLNLPVKHGAAKQTIDIIVEGKKVRQFVIELAADDVDYWVPLDVSEFEGKKATLKSSTASRKSKTFDVIQQSNKIKEASGYYKENNRQQFHFSSQRGWNNDSNGMVYYDGEYHLFYQHNPFGWAWGNMTWGHAVSKDMIHWKEIGEAIHPDEMGTIFSGGAVVDKNNTAGFQTGTEKPIVCFYTSAGGTNAWSKGVPFTQSMAYSNDRGRTWTKYQGNPIVEYIRDGNRDPKVIWHEDTKQWVMVLYLKDSEMQFLTSSDLKTWTKQSTLKSFHECPELFELPVDGDKSNMKWVLYGAAGDYFIGEFDGKEFKPDGKSIPFQHGNCFYASQTFSDMPDERKVQIAWGRIATPGMPFNQCMLLPVELSLKTTDQGVRMTAVPIREVKKLHKKKHLFEDFSVCVEKQLTEIKGELFHVIMEFAVDSAPEFALDIRGTRVVYNVGNSELSCRDKKTKLIPADGKVKLEILVDRNSIEIFGNDGLAYMPIGGILPEDNKAIKVISDGGMVDSLEIYELNSIWK